MRHLKIERVWNNNKPTKTQPSTQTDRPDMKNFYQEEAMRPLVELHKSTFDFDQCLPKGEFSI